MAGNPITLQEYQAMMGIPFNDPGVQVPVQPGVPQDFLTTPVPQPPPVNPITGPNIPPKSNENTALLSESEDPGSVEATSQSEPLAGIGGPAPIQVRQDAPIVPPENLTYRKKGARGFETDENAINALAARDINPTAVAHSEKAQAIQDETDAARLVNQRQAEQGLELAKADQNYADQYAQITAEHMQAAESEIGELKNAMEAAAAHRVEPGRRWNSSIGTALSGMFSAFTGGFLAAELGPNNIQSIIDRGIDRDIDAQKYEGAQLRAAVGDQAVINKAKQGMRTQEVQDWDNERLMRRSALIGEFEAQLNKMQDPILRARGEKIISDEKIVLAQKYDHKVQQIRQSAERERDQKNRALEAARSRAAARSNLMLKRKWQKEDAKAKAAGVDQTELVFSPNTGKVVGKLPTGLDDSSKRKFIEKSQASYDKAEALKHLMNLGDKMRTYDGPFAKFMRTEDGQRYKSAYLAYFNADLRQQSGTAVNQAEFDRKVEELPLNSILRNNGRKVWEDKLIENGQQAARIYRSRNVPTDQIYRELTVRGGTPVKGAAVDDLFIKAETNTDPNARIQAIEQINTQVQHNPSTIAKPQTLQSAKKALEYVKVMTKDAAMIGKAQRAYDELEATYKAAKRKEGGAKEIGLPKGSSILKKSIKDFSGMNRFGI